MIAGIRKVRRQRACPETPPSGFRAIQIAQRAKSFLPEFGLVTSLEFRGRTCAGLRRSGDPRAHGRLPSCRRTAARALRRRSGGKRRLTAKPKMSAGRCARVAVLGVWPSNAARHSDPRFVKILRDRTDGHRAEARLQESEERFRLLATSIRYLVFRTRNDGCALGAALNG
jgi:PAS domain-containing protein